MSVNDTDSKLELEVNPAVGSGEIVTESDCAVELPQAFVAITVTLPPFAPAVVTIELVLLLPDHPLGKVHV